jgi:Ca2+-binding RTX toxin-like protein
MAKNIILSPQDTEINLVDPITPGNGLAGDQAHAQITALPNGDFVVVYENPYAGSADHDIMAAEFTADGTIVGGGPYRLEFDGGDQILPDVAPRLAGGIVAVWEDVANSNSISLVSVAPGTAPNPPELTVFDAGYKLHAPTVGTFANGNYLVAWQAEEPAQTGLQYAVVDAGGSNVMVGPVVVPDPFNDFDGHQRIATSGNQAMLVWSHGFAESSIQMELINSSGVQGPDKLVAFHQFEDLINPEVAALADGRFVIVWERETAHDVQGKIYDPATDTFSPMFTVGITGGDQTKPSVTGLPDGGFLVTWTDNSHAVGYDYYGTGIDGQRFDSTGAPDGDPFQVDIWGDYNDQLDSAVAANASGHVAAVWTNNDFNAFADNDGSSIVGQFMQLTTEVVNGTSGDDTITTYSLGETINGLDGNDIIHAGGGNDTVSGGIGNDQLFGEDGNDLLNGGPGADLMVGGQGNDNYVVDDPGDAVVELPGQGVDAVSASIDYTLPANVERLILTGSAHNGTGNDLNNAILGNTNDNVIDGGAGADTMAGSSGNDTYFVDNTGDVVIEGAVPGIDTIKTSVDYTLPNNVENLVLLPGAVHGTGNALDNVITGNDGDNVLTGGLGNDTIDGGAGIDTAVFTGSYLSYTITRSGNDFIVSGPDGTDHLTHIEKLAFDDATVVASQPADFNGDGYSDAMLRGADGSLWINLYNGATTVGSGLAGTPTLDWDVVATADFNGDGRSDVALRNHTDGHLWFNFYNGTALVGSGAAGTPTTDWDVAGTGDFNFDGSSDILLRNHNNGQLYVNLYDGANIVGSGAAGSPTLDWDVAGIGDFNGDGHSDVMLRNHNTGQLWTNLYDGATIIGSGAAGSPMLDWDVAGIGDFNFDGHSDVMLRNHNTGELWINLYNGATIIGGGSGGTPTTDWDVARVADYNGDGHSDVMLRDHVDGHLWANFYDGTTIIGGGPAGMPTLDWQLIGV